VKKKTLTSSRVEIFLFADS